MISTLLELWITQYKEYVRQKYASSYQCYRVVLWGQPFIAYTIRKRRNTHSGKSDRQWEFSYSRDFFMNAWIPPPLARSIRRNFKSFFSTRACVALRMEAHSCPGLIPLWGLHHFSVDSSEPATIYCTFLRILFSRFCVWEPVTWSEGLKREIWNSTCSSQSEQQNRYARRQGENHYAK